MAISLIKRLLRPFHPRIVGALARMLPKNMLLDKRYFDIWQKHGYHILPVHFYEPVPDTSSLPASFWETPGRMAGVDLREDSQLRLLDRFTAQFRDEYASFPADEATAGVPFWIHNASFVSVDAEILYCMIRSLKPRRIIEIGSGFSSRIISHALRRNAAAEQAPPCRYAVIDPYPAGSLLAVCGNITSLIEAPVQQAPLAMFQELEENDILFIDSSHVSKAGSDVNYEFLDIIPSVQPGVVIHVHDIFFPFEYPRQWHLEHRRFWNEQYLLQAFLCFNSAFQVEWCGRYMHWKHPGRLEAAFPSWSPAAAPASLWMSRVKADGAPEGAYSSR